jgi:hypothetical protein
MNPNELGSGGGGGQHISYPGGNGGGLVKITAGALTLDGGIIADGGSSINQFGYVNAGGSGGGIKINVSTLSGNGTISAKGGASSYGGAGGGGRIAVYYDTLTLSTANIIASGEKSGTGTTASRNGGAGTVYLKASAQTQGDLIIDNRNADNSANGTPLRAIGSGIITSVTPTSLTNGEAAWTPGSLKGLKINPNSNQSIVFTVVDNEATTLYIDAAEGDLTSITAVGNAYIGVYSFNSMKVIGKSKVKCDDRFTVNTELLVDGSNLTIYDITADKVIISNGSNFITNVVTADTASLTNGGTLTQWNTTATTTYKLELNVTTALTIDSTSKIDVTGKGYLGGYAGGNTNTTGHTYGNTITGGSTNYSGGSYGGSGGIYSNGSVNAIYGELMNPNELGSGGGGGQHISYPGGNGGGLVKITAGALTLDGGIIADGGSAINQSGYFNGGGSGGGIKINVSTLSGNGTISAKGGATSYGGAGGGGRIAIYYTMNSLNPSNLSAAGGLSGTGGVSSRNGGAGTVYLKQGL